MKEERGKEDKINWEKIYACSKEDNVGGCSCNFGPTNDGRM